MTSSSWRLWSRESDRRFKPLEKGGEYSSNGESLSPAFPDGKGAWLRAGSCREGWLPFLVRPRTEVSVVEFSRVPKGYDPVRWETNIPLCWMLATVEC
jgi:hypothetical protein